MDTGHMQKYAGSQIKAMELEVSPGALSPGKPGRSPGTPISKAGAPVTLREEKAMPIPILGLPRWQ